MNLMPPQIDLFVYICVLSQDALIFITVSFHFFSYFPTTTRKFIAELHFFACPIEKLMKPINLNNQFLFLHPSESQFSVNTRKNYFIRINTIFKKSKTLLGIFIFSPQFSATKLARRQMNLKTNQEVYEQTHEHCL